MEGRAHVPISSNVPGEFETMDGWRVSIVEDELLVKKWGSTLGNAIQRARFEMDCVPYLRRTGKYRPSLSFPLMFRRETVVIPEII